MILVCIVFIVWISVLYSVLKSNDRENKDITGEEYKKRNPGHRLFLSS